MRNPLHDIWHLPRKTIAAAITVYQHTLSPDHGPLRHLYPYGYCRHEPTCSMYAKQKLRERGAIIGVLLGTWRILHCTPWSKISEEKILKITGSQP